MLPIAAQGAATGDAGAIKRCIRLVKEQGAIRREEHGSCRFVPLVGKFGWTA